MEDIAKLLEFCASGKDLEKRYSSLRVYVRSLNEYLDKVITLHQNETEISRVEKTEESAWKKGMLEQLHANLLINYGKLKHSEYSLKKVLENLKQE